MAATNGARLYTLIPETALHIQMSINGHSCERSFCSQKNMSFLEDNQENICRDIDDLYEHLRCKKNAVFFDDVYAPCVLAPRMASKIIHEAFGHHAEADFILDRMN